jgi:hypothetical protein
MRTYVFPLALHSPHVLLPFPQLLLLLLSRQRYVKERGWQHVATAAAA